MFDIPTILTAQELIDKVLRRAAKVSVEDRHKVYRIKKLSLGRLDSIAGNLDSTLMRYINAFPSIDTGEGTVDMEPFFESFISRHRLEITPVDLRYLEAQRHSFSRFYFELLDITVGADDLKISLASVDWGRNKCREIITKKQRQIKRMSRIHIMDSARKEAIGRVTSIIKQIAPALERLALARKQFGTFPTLSPGAPICVIAGYPNVGKSSFLKMVSGARPKIAVYPFTTRGINMGVHEEPDPAGGRKGSPAVRKGIYGRRINLVDTPGLLDRRPGERNEIEEQAAAALKHVADCILFILDPSGSCGYPVDSQESLLGALREMFPETHFIVVENKCDVFLSDSDRPKMSTLTGEGVAGTMEKVKSAIFWEQEQESS